MSTLLLVAVLSVVLATLVIYVLRLIGARRHDGQAVTSPPVAVATPLVKSTSGFAQSADNNNRVGEDESRADGLITLCCAQQKGATDEMAAVTGNDGLRQQHQRQLIQTVINQNDCPYDSEQAEMLYTQLLSKVSQRDAATKSVTLDRLEAAADTFSATAAKHFRSELEWERTRRRAAEEWAAFLLSSLDAYVAARSSHEEFRFRSKRWRRKSGEEDEAEVENANVEECRRIIEVNGGGSVPMLRRRFQTADDNEADDEAGLAKCVVGMTGVAGNGGSAATGRVGRRVDEMRAEPRITSSDSSRRTTELSRHSGRGGTENNIMATYSCWLQRYHAEQRDDPSKSRQPAVRRQPPTAKDASTRGRADDDFDAIVAYNEKILRQRQQVVERPWRETGTTAENTEDSETKTHKETEKFRRKNELETRTSGGRVETTTAGGKLETGWCSQGLAGNSAAETSDVTQPAGWTESRSPALAKLAERYERPDCCSLRPASAASPRVGGVKTDITARSTDERVASVDRTVLTTTSVKTEDRSSGTAQVKQLLPVQRYLKRQLEKQKKEGLPTESGLEAVLLGRAPSPEAAAACLERPSLPVPSEVVEKLVRNFEQLTEEAELMASSVGGSDDPESLSGRSGSVSRSSSGDLRNAAENRSSEELSTDELNEKDMWRQIVLEKCRRSTESDESVSVHQDVEQQLLVLENSHPSPIPEAENRETEAMTSWKNPALDDFHVTVTTQSDNFLQVASDVETKTADDLEPEGDSDVCTNTAATSFVGKDENENEDLTNSRKNSVIETLRNSAEDEKLTVKIEKSSENRDHKPQQQLEKRGKDWRNVVISEDLSPSDVSMSALRLSVSGEYDEAEIFDEMRSWDVDDDLLPGDEVDNLNNNRHVRQLNMKLIGVQLEENGLATADAEDETGEGLDLCLGKDVDDGVDEADPRIAEAAGGETTWNQGRSEPPLEEDSPSPATSSANDNKELADKDSVDSTEEVDNNLDLSPAGGTSNGDDVTDSGELPCFTDDRSVPTKPLSETPTNQDERAAISDRQLVPRESVEGPEKQLEQRGDVDPPADETLEVDIAELGSDTATRMLTASSDDDCQQQQESGEVACDVAVVDVCVQTSGHASEMTFTTYSNTSCSNMTSRVDANESTESLGSELSATQCYCQQKEVTDVAAAAASETVVDHITDPVISSSPSFTASPAAEDD